MQNKSTLPPTTFAKLDGPIPSRQTVSEATLRTNKGNRKTNIAFWGGGAAFRAGAFFSLASASQKTLTWGPTGRTLADFDLKSLLHSLDPRPGKGEYPNKCENPGGFFFALLVPGNTVLP